MVSETKARYAAVSPDDGSRIELRNPFLAAVLSWLVPGLGQIYQGRTFKGVARRSATQMRRSFI